MSLLWAGPHAHIGCSIGALPFNSQQSCLGRGRLLAATARPASREEMSGLYGQAVGHTCGVQPSSSRSSNLACRGSVSDARASAIPKQRSSVANLHRTTSQKIPANAAGAAALETKVFNATAASASSVQRSVSTPAVSSSATASVVLDAPSELDSHVDALSIFPQSSTSDHFENLQDQVLHFIEKYERTQSGRDAGTSSSAWTDTPLTVSVLS